MHTLTKPAAKDQELSHFRTATGTDIHIKRTPGGALRFLVRTGETDPVTHRFPVAELTDDQFRIVCLAEQTSQLGFIAEALNVHDDEGIPNALACVALELNHSREDSTAHAVLDELRALRATLARLLPAEPTAP